MLRIGILGQPCIDELIAPNGKLRSRSLGGILYSYAAMERAMRTSNREDSFLPLTWYSTPDKTVLDPFYAKLTHLRREFPWKTEALTNRVRLLYSTAADRIEHCATILPSLTDKELRDINFSTLDGIFINMISGFDIGIETMEWIRANAPSLHIHLDIHALILGDLSAEIGIGRTPQGISEWQRWIQASDTVQMNELEAKWIAAPGIASEKVLIDSICEHCNEDAGWRTKSIIITRAERGATAYQTRTNERIDIPAIPTDVIETTGSGDVFGAQFLYALLLTRDTRKSLRDAVHAASFNTTIVGVDALVNLNS